MAALRASVLQIMSRLALADKEHVTSTVSFEAGQSQQEPLLFWDILKTRNFKLKAIFASTPDALDERWASVIENKCRTTRQNGPCGPSSVNKLIGTGSRHIQECTDQCKEFGLLDTAWKHVNEGQLKPQFRITPGRGPPDAAPGAKHIRDSMYAFLGPIIDTSDWSEKALNLSLGLVLHQRHSLIKGLSIEPDFTGDQYCNFMWMHIVTLEMATRLRGMLHQRRNAQCFDEYAKNIERIFSSDEEVVLRGQDLVMTGAIGVPCLHIGAVQVALLAQSRSRTSKLVPC